MSKKIHTIQSYDKNEFDKKVNYFLEFGCELHIGGYEVIKNDDGVIYSQIVLIDTTKLDVEFHDNGEIKLLGFLNGEGKKDVTLERIKLKYYYDGKPNQRGNIKYKLEVKLENNKVVGWRDL
jgi:hypothetical protein|tara:strand:- start:63 stop:428 length:366 start_codon:yes stop_codon:yes gene_type:complete